MPLTKISKQVVLMKKFIRILGFILLMIQVVLTYVLYSNPELTPIGGTWSFLVFSGFVVLQFYYHLIVQKNVNTRLLSAVTIVILALWFSASVLLLFEPVKYIPASQIALMTSFLVVNYRLHRHLIKQIDLFIKVSLLAISGIFIFSAILLIQTESLPELLDFIRLKTTIHSILILVFIGLDRYIIDLLHAEKDVLLEIANEKTIALKSELLEEVEHRVHKPINQLRASLESVRINVYGESKEITENSIRQLNTIDKYLNSITKANKIESNRDLPLTQVLREFETVYKDWVSFDVGYIVPTTILSSNEIFGLRTLLDFAINNNNKYCSLDVEMIDNKPFFEITFDGSGMTDSILKVNYDVEARGLNESYDLKLAVRVLQKEGYTIMLSSQLLQGTRFLVISEKVDLKEYELPGKTNLLL